MIIPERITNIVFSVHWLSSLRTLFYMTEKKTVFVYADVYQWFDKTNKNLDEKKYNATDFNSFQ